MSFQGNGTDDSSGSMFDALVSSAEEQEGNSTGGNSTGGDDITNPTGSAVSWSPIAVTLLYSVLQGTAFFAFFILQRWRDKRAGRYDLYETRQFTRAHRSPPPYGEAQTLTRPDGTTERKSYGMGPLGWAVAACQLPDDETLRCVGLDSFMYLRFLRLGFRITLFGSLLGAAILVPVYATGEATGAETEDFNHITLSHVEQGSPRVWAAVICWLLFVCFVLREIWREWQNFAPLRYDFLANGDVDTARDYRYAILVENVPPEFRSDRRLREYFGRLFPNKIRQVSVCLDTSELDGLVKKRQKAIEGYERADALVQSSDKLPKPQPKVRVGGTLCCGGTKEEAMPYYQEEIDRLNGEIDGERDELHAFADRWNEQDLARKAGAEGGDGAGLSQLLPLVVPGGSHISPLLSSNRNGKSLHRRGKSGGRGTRVGEKAYSTGANSDGLTRKGTDEPPSQRTSVETAGSDGDGGVGRSDAPQSNHFAPPASEQTGLASVEVPLYTDRDGDGSDKGHQPEDSRIIANTSSELMEIGSRAVTSTAFVTFTSLLAKQKAVQCEINGRVDRMDVSRAPEPHNVVWANVTVPRTKRNIRQLEAAALWIVGVLFWAVPVTFVTSLANLDSILKSVGIHNVNSDSFLYGLISGLLPVIFLALLMMFVPRAIDLVAMNFVKMNSRPEVDGYVFFWHQLYQIANLWLILIGGSIFNQINSLVNDPTGVVNLIASAMTGSSVFFVDMIVVSSFGTFGMDLSMLPTYGVKLVKSLLTNEGRLTQRQLDDQKKPQSVKFGEQLPPIVFIFLVSLVYMPIVPVMDMFAVVYFAGTYVVWKHQCLHVYAQEYEGGGVIWQKLFVFIMGCLYMAELIFISTMGLKGGPGQFIVAFVPFVCTVIVHKVLNRNVIAPLQHLALDVAAAIDQSEGELEATGDGDQTNNHAASVEDQLYGQPSLKASMDERESLPYRRRSDDPGDDGGGGRSGGSGAKKAADAYGTDRERDSSELFQDCETGLEVEE